MFCSSADESINNLDLGQINYLRLLVPQLSDEYYLQSTSEDQTDLHHILTLPLLDQIRKIMKQGEKITLEIKRKENTYTFNIKYHWNHETEICLKNIFYIKYILVFYVLYDVYKNISQFFICVNINIYYIY